MQGIAEILNLNFMASVALYLVLVVASLIVSYLSIFIYLSSSLKSRLFENLKLFRTNGRSRDAIFAQLSLDVFNRNVSIPVSKFIIAIAVLIIASNLIVGNDLLLIGVTSAVVIFSSLILVSSSAIVAAHEAILSTVFDVVERRDGDYVYALEEELSTLKLLRKAFSRRRKIRNL